MDRKLFKETFSALCAGEEAISEVIDMTVNKHGARLEAAERRAKSRRSILRPVLIAAAVLALAGTVLAAGAAVLKIGDVAVYNSERTLPVAGTDEEDTFKVLIDVAPNEVTYFPVDALSQEIRDAAAQGDGTEVVMGWDSWGEAEAFLGLELTNSAVLEERGRPEPFGNSRDTVWSNCRVSFSANEEGPGLIWIFAHYRLDEMSIDLRAAVQTDLIRPELRGRVLYSTVTSDDTEAFAEEYRTPGGLETTVVTYSGGGGLPSVDGCFNLNGIHYFLQVVGLDEEADPQVLEKTMREILDGFQ